MSYIDPTREAFDAFKTLPRDAPVEMLNLVRLRSLAQYPAEHVCAAEGLTGDDAYGRYAAASQAAFRAVGGAILWSAAPQTLLIGPSSEAWDIAFVAR